jgi:hypothetical protein
LTLIPLIVWLPAALILFLPSLWKNAPRLSPLVILAIWTLTRLPLVIIGYVTKVLPAPDVVLWYETQVPQVLAGLLPYRDFLSPYSPFFAYLCVVPHLLGLGNLGLNLLFTLSEGLFVFLMLQVGKKLGQEPVFRLSMLLYVLSPYAILHGISAQDELFINAFFVLSVLLLFSKKSITSGVVASIGFLLTKLHALGYGVALWAAAPERKTGWNALLSFLGVTCFAFALLGFLGVSPLGPLQLDMADEMLGGTIWRLIKDLFGFVPGRWSFLITTAATAMTTLALYLRSNRSSMDLLMAPGLIFLTFLLTNRTVHPDYLLLVIPAVTLWVAYEKGILGRVLVGLFYLQQSTAFLLLGRKEGLSKNPLAWLAVGDVADYTQLVMMVLLLIYGFYVVFSKRKAPMTLS